MIFKQSWYRGLVFFFSAISAPNRSRIRFAMAVPSSFTAVAMALVEPASSRAGIPKDGGAESEARPCQVKSEALRGRSLAAAMGRGEVGDDVDGGGGAVGKTAAV